MECFGLDDCDLLLATLAVALIAITGCHRVTSGFTANEP